MITVLTVAEIEKISLTSFLDFLTSLNNLASSLQDIEVIIVCKKVHIEELKKKCKKESFGITLHFFQNDQDINPILFSEAYLVHSNEESEYIVCLDPTIHTPTSEWDLNIRNIYKNIEKEHGSTLYVLVEKTPFSEIDNFEHYIKSSFNFFVMPSRWFDAISGFGIVGTIQENILALSYMLFKEYHKDLLYELKEDIFQIKKEKLEDFNLKSESKEVCKYKSLFKSQAQNLAYLHDHFVSLTSYKGKTKGFDIYQHIEHLCTLYPTEIIVDMVVPHLIHNTSSYVLLSHFLTEIDHMLCTLLIKNNLFAAISENGILIQKDVERGWKIEELEED